MAIKGKKKSGNRGSGGARRPAQAPRPVASARKGPTPFYRTRDGMFIIGILVIVAIGTIIWAVGSARNEAKLVEQEADQLDTFTNSLRGVMQSVNVPAGEMAQIPNQASPELITELEKKTEQWRTSLSTAQQSLMGIIPEGDTESVHGLMAQALSGFLSAADTYALALETDDAKLQSQVLAQAAAQRTQASGVIDGAIAVLDDLRDEVDLGSSGLTTPATEPEAQPTAIPSGLPTEIPTPDGGGGGTGGGGGDGSGGNGGG